MSMLGNAGAETAARDVRRFIEYGLAVELGRALRDEEKALLAPIVARCRAIEDAAKSGWY